MMWQKVLSIVGQPGLRMLQRIKCLNKQYVKLVALLLLLLLLSFLESQVGDLQ